jgi:hypothetical protein
MYTKLGQCFDQAQITFGFSEMGMATRSHYSKKFCPKRKNAETNECKPLISHVSATTTEKSGKTG